MTENNHLAKKRNIGIIAHIDGGKTTTTEEILYHGGEKRNAGKVDEGTTTTDYLKAEKAKGITIVSAAVTVKIKGYKINLIDTPGHIDFTVEVARSLRVLDGAIVIIDGQAGVEAQTETVWMQAREHQLPLIFFINKMDKLGANFPYSLKTIEEKLNASCLVLQLPIGSENNFQGIIDIVELKAYYFTPGDKEENYKTKEIPANLLKETEEYRHNLIEKLIGYDNDLDKKYFDGEKFENFEIKKLIRQATLTGNLFPIFCGSAFKKIGVKLLLDGVLDYLPSPLDRKNVKAFSINDKSEEIMISPQQPNLMALAFKIINDPYVGKLAFVRVYSGELKSSYVYNVSKGIKVRISKLVRMHANVQENIDLIESGDIGAIAGTGAKDIATGDTLSGEDNHFLLEKIKFADPVISLAIEPEREQDREKLILSLSKLADEDPTFKYWMNSETKQMIIAGMGELHLEILVDRLKDEYKLAVKVGNPEVAYRETIKNTVEEARGEYKRQSGGHGQFGRVFIKFEPNPGKGFEFVDAIREGTIPQQFIEPVKEGLIQALSSGPLMGYPVVDIKATLYNGAFHEIDSSPFAFSVAASICFRENKDKFKLALLEPNMQVEIVTPKDYYGSVLADLVSRRGEISKTEENEQTKIYRLYVKIPLSEMFGYSTILRRLTKGRGIYSMQFSHYQEVPSFILEKLLQKNPK